MAVGQVLNDRYRLDSMLGRGGRGAVWLGMDLLLGRPVAVKTIHVETPRGSDRFLREARTLAAIRSPGVVPILDFGTSPDGSVFLVMEHVEGPTLAGRLAVGPLTESETLALVSSAARSLSTVHAAGMVHRDIKPANIMLKPDGTVTLVDFGIAVSPDDPITAATDLHALGAVAYECLAGRPPFDGPAPTAVGSGHLTEEPPPLPPGVSAATASLIGRALAKAPADRWPNAASMAQATDQAIAALLSTRSAPTPTRPSRHKPLMLVAGVTALASVAAIMIWALPGSGDTQALQRQPQAAPTPASVPATTAAIAPPPVPDAAAWWQFGAADSPAPGLMGNAALEADAEHNGILTLDGFSGYATAAVPALDPTKAFTIAVWARFSGQGAGERRDITIASIPGENASAFLLQYKSTWGASGWHFAMPRADTFEPPVDTAASAIAPEPGRWYLVVGVHDPASRQISLYVDGELQASARHISTWQSAKPLHLGVHLWTRRQGGHWPGALDKAVVYRRALTPAEVETLKSW